MKVIEQFTCGKKNQDSLNEDLILVTDDFIAVMDGVTSKTCQEIEGKSGGRFAVECGADVIRNFPKDITAHVAIDLLTKALRKSVREKIKISEEMEPPAFGVIIYSKEKKEVWRVADLQLMLDGELYLANKEVDEITSNTRSLAIEMALRNGTTEEDIQAHDLGRDVIMPLLKGQHFLCNQTGLYGYGVINGQKVPDDFINIFDVADVEEIIFTSDGYPDVFRTLSESEDYLKSVLKEDPLLFRKFKSTKGLQAGNVSFDDRAYIRFLT